MKLDEKNAVDWHKTSKKCSTLREMDHILCMMQWNNEKVHIPLYKDYNLIAVFNIQTLICLTINKPVR